MSKDTTAETLLATLKRHNPYKVKAYNGDEDSRDIAVPTRRRRWAQVIAAIDARAWSRVELLDKGGAVLAYVENESGAGGIEDLGESFQGVKGGLLLGERIAQLALKCSREAVASRDAEMVTLLRAQGDTVRAMSEATKSLAEVYREQAIAAEETAETRANADAQAAAVAAAGSGGLKELMEALPVIMQAMPMLRALLAGGSSEPSPARPKNGA